LKISRVIFLSQFHFNERDFQRFGIELLLKNRLKVEIWDLASLINPVYHNEYNFNKKENHNKNIITKSILSEEEAFREVQKLTDEDIIFSVMGYDKPIAVKMHNDLHGKKAFFGTVLCGGSCPMVFFDKESFREFLYDVPWQSKLFFLTYFTLIFIKKIIRKLLLKKNNLKPFRFIMAGGRESIYPHIPRDKDTRIIYTHNWDYDRYLEFNDKKKVNEDIVFLDEYYPFHSDYLIIGKKPPLEADYYYYWLNDFFLKVEEKYNKEVVIAAHPLSQYENQIDFFHGRKVIKAKTPELVSKAFLVLAHQSFSSNYANLFEKPIIFLTLSPLNKRIEGKQIYLQASWFGKKPITIDKGYSVDWERELVINKERYRNYRENYIKIPDTAIKNSWLIFLEQLKKI
jgi:hypothetical protein